MKRIYKVILALSGEPQEIRLEKGAEPLYVDCQGDEICLWYLFSSSVEGQLEPRMFEVFGTGNPIPLHAKYIGSAQRPPFVWHVFEHLGKMRNHGTWPAL